MRDEYARQMNLVVQPAEPLPQFLSHPGVERPERLVQQQHLRLDGQRPGERDPLPLSAGKLMRIAVRHAFQLHEFQQPHDLELDQLPRRPLKFRPHTQPEGHVLEHGHVPKQGIVLKYETDLPAANPLPGDVLVVKQYCPAARVRLFQPGDDPQQRGFSRAGRPEQRNQFAGLYAETNVPQRGERAESFRDIADFYAHFGISFAIDTSPAIGCMVSQ